MTSPLGTRGEQFGILNAMRSILKRIFPRCITDAEITFGRDQYVGTEMLRIYFSHGNQRFKIHFSLEPFLDDELILEDVIEKATHEVQMIIAGTYKQTEDGVIKPAVNPGVRLMKNRSEKSDFLNEFVDGPAAGRKWYTDDIRPRMCIDIPSMTPGSIEQQILRYDYAHMAGPRHAIYKLAK